MVLEAQLIVRILSCDAANGKVSSCTLGFCLSGPGDRRGSVRHYGTIRTSSQEVNSVSGIIAAKQDPCGKTRRRATLMQALT